MREDLDAAKTLAVRAGAILLKYYAQPSVSWKGPGNPVTEADREASTFIVQELRRRFPEDGILSEEESDDVERLSRSRTRLLQESAANLFAEVVAGIESEKSDG